MPVPKRKSARTVGRNRRAHWKARVMKYTYCPNCGEPILPHTVCPRCGYYKGIKIYVTKFEKETEELLNE